MHSAESLVGPVDGWHESCLPLGGEGCPEVAEFAVVEFAAAMGRSTESGRRYLSHAVEGRYRLPRCWARVESGELAAWRLAFIADRTLCLSPEAAAFVDAKVAPFAHTIGPAQLGRLVEEAKARFDPDARPRPNAGPRPRPGTSTSRWPTPASAGTVRIDGDLDLADALDLEAAIAADAHQQLLLGSTDSLDVRRAIAAGNLARTQHTLDLSTTHPAPAANAASARWCCTSTSSTPPCSAPVGSPGSRRPGPGHRRAGPRVVRQPRDPGHRPAGARPRRPPPCRVLRSLGPAQAPDPAPRPHLRVPVLLPPRRALRLRPPRPARPAETTPARPAPATSPPCCRRHHRAKTTGGWTYLTIEPGTYLWRSPLGYQFLRDHTGTLDVTPDPERRRLAHEFRRPLRRTLTTPPRTPLNTTERGRWHAPPVRSRNATPSLVHQRHVGRVLRPSRDACGRRAASSRGREPPPG